MKNKSIIASLVLVPILSVVVGTLLVGYVASTLQEDANYRSLITGIRDHQTKTMDVKDPAWHSSQSGLRMLNAKHQELLETPVKGTILGFFDLGPIHVNLDDYAPK